MKQFKIPYRLLIDDDTAMDMAEALYGAGARVLDRNVMLMIYDSVHSVSYEGLPSVTITEGFNSVTINGEQREIEIVYDEQTQAGKFFDAFVMEHELELLS